MSPTKKMNLLEPRVYYKPFEYPEAYIFYENHESLHWVPKEVPLAQDVIDWNKKLTENERTFLTQIFRFFTQADTDVAGAYASKYLPVFSKPEIRMMLLSFASREAVHMAAYSHLIDTLGMPEITYKQFLEYEVMKDKHEYFEQSINKDDKQLVQQMVAVSAMTEGVQLFASFIMLLNFTRFNKMNGMGQIVTWSIRDEQCLHEDADVLTDRGWVNIKDVTTDSLVAQYDTTTGEVSYVHPTDVVCSYERESYVFEGDEFYQHVTPGHRMVLSDSVVTAEECSDEVEAVVSGIKSGESVLSDEDKKIIEQIVAGTVTPDWIYHKIPTVSSVWAEQAVLYYLELTN